MDNHPQEQYLLTSHHRDSSEDIVSPLESIQGDDTAQSEAPAQHERPSRRSSGASHATMNNPVSQPLSRPFSIPRKQIPTPSDRSGVSQEEAAAVIGHSVEATHYWWWWDITGAVVAVICMILIVVALVKADGIALESWPLAISLNTIIATLTTVARTALLVPLGSSISQLKWRHILLQARPLHHLQLFDDASRGPWGSVIMIRHLFLQSKLACALGFATILALGISPSAQQILEYPLRDRDLPHIDVAIGRADGYFSKGFIQRPGVDWKFRVPNTDLPAFQSQVLHALAGSLSQPQFSCPPPAVRCEWEEFTSLAVCSNFQNQTDRTTRRCSNTDSTAQGCNYTIPLGNGPGEEEEYEIYMEYYNHNAYGYAENTHVLRTEFIQAEGSRGDTRGWLGHFIVVRHQGIEWESLTTPATPEVFVADFRWCKKTYKGTVARLGILEVEDESAEETPLAYSATEDDVYWEDIMETANGVDRYRFTRTLTDDLPFYLSNLLRSEHGERRGGRPTLEPRPTSAMQMQYVLYTADIANLTKQLEQVLTNQARSSEPGDNRNATLFTQGRAFGEITFIRVRWQWFALPAGGVLLSIGLFVWTIIITSKTPLLKNSLLATLFYPLRGWREDEVYAEGPQTGEKLEKLAKGLSGRMETDAGRYRIVRDQSPTGR